MKTVLTLIALLVSTSSANAAQVCLDLEKPVACACETTHYVSNDSSGEDTVMLKFTRVTASGKIVTKNVATYKGGSSCYNARNALINVGMCPADK